MNPRFGITMPSSMFHRHCFAVIASVGAIALVAILAAEVVFSRLISAELGLAYLAFSRISSLSDAIAKLLEFHEIWYRPLTLYVTNYLVFRVIDTHDFITLKALGFCIIALNALVATWLARRVLSSGFVECVLIFSLIVSHPLYFRNAYDGSGIGDPVFTIFLNLFLICYLTLLEASNPRLGHTIRLARGRSLLLCVLCGVFVIGTVIAHERGLAIFMMAGALFAFYHLPQRSRRAVRWSPAEIGTMLWCAVVFLAYLAFVYANKKAWAGAHYRTGLDVDYILPKSTQGDRVAAQTVDRQDQLGLRRPFDNRLQPRRPAAHCLPGDLRLACMSKRRFLRTAACLGRGDIFLLRSADPGVIRFGVVAFLHGRNLP